MLAPIRSGLPPNLRNGATRNAEVHRATADRVRTACRRHAAEHSGDHHPVGHARGAREGVRAATGQADDGHLVDPERVRDGAQVVGERGNGLVTVRCRRADTGPVDADQTDVVLFGVDPGLGRDLPAGPRRSVQPEDGTPPRGAELGEADLAVFADGDVSFEFGAGYRDGHAQQLRMRLSS